MHTHGAQHSSAAISASSTCSAPGATHVVVVSPAGFTPDVINVHLCDSLVFRNQTSGPIDVAVGEHEHHSAYPGLTEKQLIPGESTTAIMRAKGSFELHEHVGDVFHAELVVD